jgi:hypothetical protein
VLRVHVKALCLETDGGYDAKAEQKVELAVNGGAKTGHGAAQKSASLGVTGALANALPI